MKYIQPDWIAPSWIKAYTTTRLGWGGRLFKKGECEGADDSLQLRACLPLPSEPIWLNQIHSTLAVEGSPKNINQIADASFTHEPNRVCIVSTADCLPILICNQVGTHVAAIHAGWRGLAAGIIEATLAKLDLPANQVLVWLGPAIGRRRYEVGKDVYEAFTHQHAESAHAFTPQTEGKWLADLYALAKLRLKLQGIETSHIYGGQFCTFTQSDLFFSYRRDQGRTGRMASLIWVGEE